MPHLSPMSWIMSLILFWASVSIMNSTLWWSSYNMFTSSINYVGMNLSSLWKWSSLQDGWQMNIKL